MFLTIGSTRPMGRFWAREGVTRQAVTIRWQFCDVLRHMVIFTRCLGRRGVCHLNRGLSNNSRGTSRNFTDVRALGRAIFGNLNLFRYYLRV